MRGAWFVVFAALAAAQDARITGRVLDEAGAPAAAFRLQIQAIDAVPPRVVNTTTDGEGFFSAQALPGAYRIRVAHTLATPESVLTEFTEADLAPERRIATAYWPGGVADPGRVVPLAAHAGGTADAGTIRLHTAPHYGVKLNIEDCTGTADLQVIREFREWTPELASVPCGEEALVTGLPAGSYWFAAVQGPQPARWGLERVVVTGKDDIVRVRMQPTTEIAGRFVMAGGAAWEELPYSRLALVPQPEGILVNNGSHRIDADGRFQIASLFWPTHRVITTLPPGFVAAAVRYNGSLAVDETISVAPGVTGVLEVTVENQGATLTGRVSGGAEGEELMVVVAREGVILGYNNALTDVPVSAGQFRIEGLTPGSYRALAVPAERLESLLDPAGYRSAFAAGVPITLGKGQTKDVALTVSH